MDMMKNAFVCLSMILSGCIAPLSVCAGQQVNAPEDGRTIHLQMDDAQIHFASRIYELKYATPEDVLPFVNSAILRYNCNSTIRRINPTDNTAKGALLVSTGENFLPYVDQIIAALDRPGNGKDPVIQGTGITRIAYTPKYRAAAEFADIINTTISSPAGSAYVNEETNTIIWRDQADAAKATLAWVEKLDRPLPQVNIRLNYYELRDSDLKDWGFDYLAWKNGPGVNLFNVGYNAGHIAIDELLETVQYAATASWGFGGFMTAPQIDMSFIRCLQQSGNASLAANASLTVLSTPVHSPSEYAMLLQYQAKNPTTAPFIYRTSMYPEYQNVAKNILGRSFVGKSYYEDDDGEKHSDPPVLDMTIINPFICARVTSKDTDPQGFIPYSMDYYRMEKQEKGVGGVIFQYALNVKNVVERGNTGAELSNSTIFAGSATLGFNQEKLLAVYEKENDVEQTIGLPILCRIPYIKYLFSTVTTIKERTYIVVTVEADLVHPDAMLDMKRTSETTKVERRIENPFRKDGGKEEVKK